MYNFVQHGCRRGIDRSKRRDYVRVKGVDANGNIIEGTAGSGSNVTVITKTQPSDQATLTLLAVQKLAELNTDNTGTPIILPISVGAFLKLGDSIPLHIPQLAMDSIYQIKRLTKGSTRVRMEVEASTVIYESTLENLKETSLEQLSLRAGVKFTRSDSGSAPASPLAGDMWYQTDTNLYFYYDGSTWQQFQPV